MKDMIVVDLFEQEVAKYSGSKYGVAISSCSNALFLSLQYLKYVGEIKDGDTIEIPSHTFLSVPCQIKHCGLKIKFEDKEWSGIYKLEPTRVYDCATRFTSDMFIGGSALQCLSFQYKKQLKIGRGGCVITNDFDAVKWLRKARVNGRDITKTQAEDELEFSGWNMYFLPEQASRGLSLLEALPKGPHPDCGSNLTYPDISKQKVFQ